MALRAVQEATEWNQWMESEKREELSRSWSGMMCNETFGNTTSICRYLILRSGERQKEVAQLEQTLSDNKVELNNILYQQIMAEEKTEQIRKEGEVIHGRGVRAFSRK